MAEFDTQSFWDKLRRFAARAGREVAETALKLYYALMDADTPRWARATIASALAYFVLPADAIPDLLPGGYVDDLGALAAAATAVAAHIKDEHVIKARQTLARWFGPGRAALD